MRTPIILTAILAALVCALPASAAAASASDRIYYDCEHSATGELTGSYTKAQLRTALQNLPGDVSEYSGCHDAIKQALLDGGHGASGGGGGNGSGQTGGAGNSSGPSGTGAGTAPGSTPTSGGTGGGSGTPAPRHVGSKAPVTLAGATIQPGVIPTIGRDGSTLPTALLVFLVLLGAGALTLVAATIGRRVVARRRA